MYQQGLTEGWSAHPENVPYVSFICLEWETELQPLKKMINEVKSDRERQTSYDVAYMQNLKKKNDSNELIYKTQTDSQTWNTSLWLPKGKGRGGMDWGFGTDISPRYIRNRCSTGICSIAQGTLPNISVITCVGKESEKGKEKNAIGWMPWHDGSVFGRVWWTRWRCSLCLPFFLPGVRVPF